MDFILQIFVFVLKVFIFIGDKTIEIFQFIANLAKNIKLKTKLKKAKPTKLFPLPIMVKFKYFVIGTFFSFIFVFTPLIVLIFIQDLPNPKQLSFQQAPLTTKIFDREGNLLFQIYANQNRTLVPLSLVPKYLRDATIAIEDKNFYKNSGFDPIAIVRAAISNLSGNPLQGGSTLTQQLIKSTLVGGELSLRRKVKELILALWTERIYTKDQILEFYLNQVPYGGTAWGAESAAEIYFGKQIQDLTLGECAFLAGLTRAPSVYSPYGESDSLWKRRQKEVLEKMKELRYITAREKKEAEKKELVFLPAKIPLLAPHFTMYIKDLLMKKYGIGLVEKGGLKVITTLDLKTQKMAEQIVEDEVQKDAYLNLTNGAALITAPKNGDILAMVGSHNYHDENSGNVNLTTSLRQPGSSIKVVTYSAALSMGFTPATMIDDSPVNFSSPGAPPYSPVNYDGKFHGWVSLRKALANSLNIPAVKILAQVGVSNMIDLGKRMGITTWDDSKNYGLSITLGAADVKMTDMATVYGTLANRGERVDLNPILKITDGEGTVLEEKKNVPRKKVLDHGVAFLISNILSDNAARSLEFGLDSPLNIKNHTVSVKTGTSDYKRDNWTIGYTPNFVTAVWVGNNDNSPMSQSLASGITGAAPIWHDIMVNLLSQSSSSSGKLDIPQNVIQKDCIGRKEYFIKGTENSVNCNPPPMPTPTRNP